MQLNSKKEQCICVQSKFLKLMDLLKLWNEMFQKPNAMEVRIKVQACGICHSDSFTKQGLFPGIQYPRVPGHEVAGVIDEVGRGVISNGSPDRESLLAGMVVIVATCESCRRGDFITCKYAQVPGISYDGGYADYMIAPK